jgi:CheY-like chemotaxis protein
VSGYGQNEDVLRSHEAGFAAHLTKPIPRERLIETMASVVSSPGA